MSTHPDASRSSFLRPATFEKLIARLQDDDLKHVDILHFDGHGVFDGDGKLQEKAKADGVHLPGTSSTLLRDALSGDGTNTGYLLFENKEGSKHLVPADAIGRQLHQSKIGLVVLSACQTAMVGSNEDAMGSVAARLTSTGIPSVLAMSHSVLVPTTGLLFSHFYEQLARGQGVGTALERARNYLREFPQRFEVQRGPVSHWLELQDWCVPTLYQPGNDGALLIKKEVEDKEENLPTSNVPPLTVPFCGRQRELWEIERWFVEGARCVNISGFGGQGKTYLAQEAGRWLLRTNMFQQVVFVSFAAYQGMDAVNYALAAIAVAINESLVDAAGLHAVLKDIPTLLILDNLEDVPHEQLTVLLNAAKEWAEVGKSRVLMTARPEDLHHLVFTSHSDSMHRHLSLGPLRAGDAFALYAAVLALPPAPRTPPPSREVLHDLFEQVNFHPLSIRLLSQQLKTRRAVDVSTRLHEILLTDIGDDKDQSLRVSLKLSLDRLSPNIREQWLPRLGVFQGGAMETILVDIAGFGPEPSELRPVRQLLAALERSDMHEATLLLLSAQEEREISEGEVTAEQIAQTEENADELIAHLRAELSQFPPPDFTEGVSEDTWPMLKEALLSVSLIEEEDLSSFDVSTPFLRFHPALPALLWGQLNQEQQTHLITSHRFHYYHLALELISKDHKTPQAARAVTQRELANLLYAVHNSLDVGDSEVVKFAAIVSDFLNHLGLKRDAKLLSERMMDMEDGHPYWFPARFDRCIQLIENGQPELAKEILTTILYSLGDEPSNDLCLTLTAIGRCFRILGQPHTAIQYHHHAKEVANQLENDDLRESTCSIIGVDLGNALRIIGKYREARTSYEESLTIDKKTGYVRGQAITHLQIGNLDFKEGKLNEAARRYHYALELFRQLREPQSEATAWHQLGILSQIENRLDEAERYYREAARIREAQGDLAHALKTWNHLGQVAHLMGRTESAETWFRKALSVARQRGDSVELSHALHAIAVLLQSQKERLDEARQFAEEALVYESSVPLATEIWSTYHVLWNITNQQGEILRAKEYRKQARDAYLNFVGSEHDIKLLNKLVEVVLLVDKRPDQREKLDEALSAIEDEHKFMVIAIHRLLEGERDEEALCEELNYSEMLVIEMLLARLKGEKRAQYD